MQNNLIHVLELSQFIQQMVHILHQELISHIIHLLLYPMQTLDLNVDNIHNLSLQ